MAEENPETKDTSFSDSDPQFKFIDEWEDIIKEKASDLSSST